MRFPPNHEIEAAMVVHYTFTTQKNGDDGAVIVQRSILLSYRLYYSTAHDVHRRLFLVV
jgi:hypothetical protein